ncbi:hypothetical protein CXG45_27965 [Pseudomonas plecoglossicida]|uniref:Uncharacterized protein n=1 Tax=Pseudomonas plecoglossicida TaxID=70775 RepID=A0ABX4TTM2_PSEDL|nr:hypothetical protein [Pseudomonas plecoglossicida]PLU84098.1 hypothetical protein CXG44_28045 [Pseudomonas plecoglossicida]PLU88992.1 hypothetical protein CXG45_27965 [Pseudomonas plecoglossicida]PLU97019.1 hypothetical protein CXG48_28000 [Pseudomonas plecoglossicida]PLV06458.1 hypothetical protein CXG47_28025 [Pseudomonas plecoglossicida]
MQPKQDTSSKPQLKVAEQVKALKITGEGALWDLESDMGQFEWLKTLMWVIKRDAEDGKAGSTDRIKQLADIGNYLAEDRANILDGICERLKSSMDAIGGAQ